MMSESDKRDIELMRKLAKSKSVQEFLEITKALKWEFSEEEAQECFGLITQDTEDQKPRQETMTTNQGDNKLSDVQDKSNQKNKPA